MDITIDQIVYNLHILLLNLQRVSYKYKCIRKLSTDRTLNDILRICAFSRYQDIHKTKLCIKGLGLYITNSFMLLDKRHYHDKILNEKSIYDILKIWKHIDKNIDDFCFKLNILMTDYDIIVKWLEYKNRTIDNII